MQLSDRARKALVFAAEAHANQMDKGGAPYISHPVAVAVAAVATMCDQFEYFGVSMLEYDDVFITGLLHDVVEDCGVSLDVIEKYFGKKVRDAVDGVTRRETPEQKELYFDFVRRSKLNPISHLIKIVDIEDNMRPERLNQLPESERGVVERYKKALAILMEREPHGTATVGCKETTAA